MVKKIILSLLVVLILISGCSPDLPLSDEDFEIAKKSVQCFYIQRLKGKCLFDNKVDLLDFYPVESNAPESKSYAVIMRFSPFNCNDREPELEHCSKMYITDPMETCSKLESRHVVCDKNQTEPIPLRIE